MLIIAKVFFSHRANAIHNLTAPQNFAQIIANIKKSKNDPNLPIKKVPVATKLIF